MDLGSLIRESRTARGWGQAELATRLEGIATQQTISRWEKNGSRPGREAVLRLAALFEDDTQDWLTVAGYGPTATTTTVTPPVETRLQRLKLDELTPENFELFCRALVGELLPHAHVARMGKEGHTQGGIDLIATGPEGTIATYQCKRSQTTFGPAKVSAAVHALKVDSPKSHLLLSRIATPAARLEMTKHTGWELWDAEDISQKLRDLPKDRAAVIIDSFFGSHWRASFLGMPEPGPWLTTDEFFRPFEGTERTFSHSWDIVGRTPDIENVSTALRNDRLVAIHAGGGSGKSRLLKAIGHAAEKTSHVRFVANGLTLDTHHLDSLPAGRLLIVVDDAHDRQDLAVLMHAVARLRDDITVLMTTRPYRLEALRSQSADFGIELQDIELKELSLDDHTAISKEVLRSHGANEVNAERIAHATKQCVLATVVGSALIGRHAVPVSLLSNEEEFRTEIMRHFQDVILGTFGIAGDGDELRNLLHAVALLQPVAIDDPQHRDALSAVLATPWDKIVRSLYRLRDGGVLVQRGQSLRIVPDLLADYMVASECVDAKTGEPTGYADRVFSHSSGQPSINLMTNLAKLDWRLSAGNLPSKPLLESMWKTLRAEFDAADGSGRRSLLRVATDLAYFQSVEAYELVRYAVDHPVQAPTTEWGTSQEDILRSGALVLRNAAYGAHNARDLDPIVDLLWELGRADPRPLHQATDHPVRVLQDLIEYSADQPVGYSQLILDRALTWLDTRVDADVCSPFDVLDKVLATDGYDTKSAAHTITFHPFTIRPEVVSPLREQVVGAALAELRSANIRQAMRATQTLVEAMHGPRALFGREVSDDEYESWVPEITKVVGLLAAEVRLGGIDDFVLAKIDRNIRWMIKRGRFDALKESARLADEAIRKDVRYRVSSILSDPWRMEEDGEADDTNLMQRIDTARTELISAAIDEMGLDGFVQFIVERIQKLHAARAGSTADAGPVIWTATSNHPDVGRLLATEALTPASSITPYLGNIISATAQGAGTKEACALATSAVALDDVLVTRRVAWAYGWGRRGEPALTDDEKALVERLARETDEQVRVSLAPAIETFARSDRDRAMRLFAALRPGDSEHLASEVLRQFGRHGTIKIDTMTARELDLLLGVLRTTPNLDDYATKQVIDEIAKTKPSKAVELLIDRLELSAELGHNYRAVPYDWSGDDALDLRDAPDFESYLRRIRNLLIETRDEANWHSAETTKDLFAAVAGRYDEAVLRVLNEWVNSQDQHRVLAAAELLSGAGENFVFENTDFTTNLITVADSLGPKTLGRVKSRLRILTESGGRHGPIGEPFPRDIEQRDKARHVAAGLPARSPSRAFYDQLAKSAEEAIREATANDELEDW